MTCLNALTVHYLHTVQSQQTIYVQQTIEYKWSNQWVEHIQHVIKGDFWLSIVTNSLNSNYILSTACSGMNKIIWQSFNSKKYEQQFNSWPAYKSKNHCKNKP